MSANVSEHKQRKQSHKVVSQREWLVARKELLEAEKDLTRRNDELAKRRQQLPWVSVEKPYKFDTADGTASLADLFRGRSQLLVYHFMFGPEYMAGCMTCSPGMPAVPGRQASAEPIRPFIATAQTIAICPPVERM